MKKIYFILATFLVLVLGVVLVGISTDWGTSGKPAMPAYNEIECKVYDTGVKSQVTRHIILLDSVITKEQLHYLTETLVSASEKTKMKYHNGKPTHIFIYIHNTEDSYKSGIWTNCIATYMKVGADDSGKYSYQSKVQ